MDAVPYFAQTYFPPSYFYEADLPVSNSSTTGQLPDYAPTYFAPSYFADGMIVSPAVSPTPAPALTSGYPYNTPRYFSPSYFWVPSVTLVIPEPAHRDHDSYLTIIALLNATGVFEEVIFGAATQRSQAGADSYPLAIVTPRGWEEVDDYDPSMILRRMTFSITVVVKVEDADSPFAFLDQLTTAIKSTVDRSNLDGTCLSALTRIRTARYEHSTHYPEQSIELEGEFSTFIDPSTNVTIPS